MKNRELVFVGFQLGVLPNWKDFVEAPRKPGNWKDETFAAKLPELWAEKEAFLYNEVRPGPRVITEMAFSGPQWVSGGQPFVVADMSVAAMEVSRCLSDPAAPMMCGVHLARMCRILAWTLMYQGKMVPSVLWGVTATGGSQEAEAAASFDGQILDLYRLSGAYGSGYSVAKWASMVVGDLASSSDRDLFYNIDTAVQAGIWRTTAIRMGLASGEVPL